MGCDTDFRKFVIKLGNCAQQVKRATKLAQWLRSVPTGNEHADDWQIIETLHDLSQVCPVLDHSRGDMRHKLETSLRKSLSHVERHVDIS
jgi:hypothetical protein